VEYPAQKKHRIRPEDIKLRKPISAGRFGKYEVEVAAGQLVKFFQMRNYWTNFTLPELIEFYRIMEWDLDLMLFGLLGAWFDDGGAMGGARVSPAYTLQVSDGTFCITEKFILRCMEE